jgi:hypothetical protein
VIAGRFSDAAWALAAVGVELYCSDNADQLGEKVSGIRTATDGWFELTVPRSCPFYNLVVRNVQVSAEYIANIRTFGPIIADTVDGRTVSKDWIQYQHPLEGRDLKNNIFWMAPADEPPPAATLVPKLAPTLPPPATPKPAKPTPTQAVPATSEPEARSRPLVQWLAGAVGAALAAGAVLRGIAARRRR